MNGAKILLFEKDTVLFDKLSFSLQKAGFSVGQDFPPLGEDLSVYRKFFVVGSPHQLAEVEAVSQYLSETRQVDEYRIFLVERDSPSSFNLTCLDLKLPVPFTPRQLIMLLISLT